MEAGKVIDPMGKPAPVQRSSSMPKVRAVERAVKILRAFTPEQPRLGLSEIARAVALDKATVLRLLMTLESCGLVLTDPMSKTYSLSYNVVALGAGVPEQADIQQIAEPVLREISARTECMAFLSTFGDNGALCVARSFVDLPVRVRLWSIGETRPYHQGAAPRLLFAHLPETRQQDILTRPLPRATAQTVTDPAQLLRDATALRGQRWCMFADDIVVGLAGIGHGVYRPDGELMAAVSVSGLTPMVAGERTEAIRGILADAAEELQRLFKLANLDTSTLIGT